MQAALILELGRAGRRLDQVRSHMALGNSQQGLQVVFHPMLGQTSVQTRLLPQTLLKLDIPNDSAQPLQPIKWSLLGMRYQLLAGIADLGKAARWLVSFAMECLQLATSLESDVNSELPLQLSHGPLASAIADHLRPTVSVMGSF